MPVLTNYHKAWYLKQAYFSWKQSHFLGSSKISFSGLKSKWQEGQFPSGESGKINSLSFPAFSYIFYISWLMALFFIFKDSSIVSCFNSYVIFCLCSQITLSFSLMKTLLIIFMAHLDNSGLSHHLKSLNLIISAKFLLLQDSRG